MGLLSMIDFIIYIVMARLMTFVDVQTANPLRFPRQW
jgi:hypothetical protein